MILFLTFLKSYWKHLIVIIAIATVSFITYNYIYDIGFKAANVACEQRMKEYNLALQERITSLEITSVAISQENKDRDEARKKDLEKLLVLTKNKPLTIIKEGNCLPSDTFVETFNAAIARVNEK